jgi:large repetitive protein
VTRTPRLAVLALLAALACALSVSSASALDINAEVTLQDGEVGVPYEFQFTGDEGCQPYHFTLKSGTLAPGLTLQDDGKLVGTPTEAGTFDFWVELSDGIPGGACHSPVPSQGEFSVFIAPQVVITGNLVGAKLGAPFSAVITATGGGSLQWTVDSGALPPGLVLNRDNGTLSGTPSAAGTYPFTVKVGDAKRKTTKAFSFVVGAPLAVQPTLSMPAAEVGRAFSATIGSDGGIGPLAWATTGALPSGLTLDPAKGVIQGTPAAAGSFSLPVTVTDVDGQTVTATVALTVAARPAITVGRLGTARAGRSYRARLTSRGGVAPRAWRVVSGRLPAGITLNRSTGALTGSPRIAGSYKVTVRLTDRLGGTASRTVTIVVASRS